MLASSDLYLQGIQGMPFFVGYSAAAAAADFLLFRFQGERSHACIFSCSTRYIASLLYRSVCQPRRTYCCPYHIIAKCVCVCESESAVRT